MSHDNLKKIVQSVKPMAERIKQAENALGGADSIRRMVKNIHNSNKVLSAASGPLGLLHRKGALEQIVKSQSTALRLAEEISKNQKLFTLPTDQRMAELAKLYKPTGASGFIKLLQENRQSIQEVTRKVKNPWLNTLNEMQSVRAIANLNAIGAVLMNPTPFDDQSTGFLRDNLGDWRNDEPITDLTAQDPLARSDYYQEKGFDMTLTFFPESAFDEIAELAQLTPVKVEFVEDYLDPASLTYKEMEHAFYRTNKAHDILQRFETKIRDFIESQMTKSVGANWAKQRVDSKTYSKWEEKRDIARKKGSTIYPLIAYADFTDYEPIIIRKDNWRDVFERYFIKKPSIEESFRRLYPIRICTMHSRLVTKDDQLLLVVEVKRLLKAMR